ncbi:MAG: recombinase family protein [bacterium]|nr:recombinase family protein [bacterium]
MVYLYARISTNKQSIERQIRNLKSIYPNGTIIQESFTGTTNNRPEWNKLNKVVKRGDTIVFDSVSRMSRNATEGFQMYDDLFRRGVELVFLKEPLINTETYKSALKSGIPMTGGAVDMILDGINRYLLELAREQIKLAFIQSEKEVADLRQRTREGMETARLNGKQIGRESGKTVETKKAKAAKIEILKHSQDFGGALTDSEMMKFTGLSRNTFYKYKRELKERSE